MNGVVAEGAASQGGSGHERLPNQVFWRSRSGLALLGFIGIAAFFLFAEHRAHVLGALPYVLLLLCPLVIINSLVFIIFAFSFTHPAAGRDWRSLGAFSAFIVALFTEMYGLPLTIYLLSGWLGSRFPGLDLLSHDSGHLWHTLLRMEGNPHFDPLHLLSNAFVLGGFVLLSAAWRVLYKAQRDHGLATTGPYARLRHPQYAAFVLIMLGFLLQWPTLPTLGSALIESDPRPGPTLQPASPGV